MKKVFFIFFPCWLIACSYKIIPGKYSCGRSNITVDSNNNYKLSNSGEGVGAYSKGTIVQHKRKIEFIPDSSLFFRIMVKKCYFDSTYQNNRKIILDNSNNSISLFTFYFYTGDGIIFFDSSYSTIYKPGEQKFEALHLNALYNSSIFMSPIPPNESVSSNFIQVDDIPYDKTGKPWNVVELKVVISDNMFYFKQLPKYTIKHKKLIPGPRVYKML